jgi:hypothetical protein
MGFVDQANVDVLFVGFRASTQLQEMVGVTLGCVHQPDPGNCGALGKRPNTPYEKGMWCGGKCVQI